MKLQEIKKLTILELGVDIDIESRAREIVYARAIYYKLCREFTKQPLSAIGREVGKDHATVLHACKTVNNLMDTDKRFRGYIDDLKKKISLQ